MTGQCIYTQIMYLTKNTISMRLVMVPMKKVMEEL